MNKKLTLFLAGLIGLCTFSAFVVADDPFDELLKKLDAFSKKFPSEKVYLHLDKPYYATAEDIWFKAYVVDSKTNKLTTMSNVLYVDLINESNTIIKHLTLPMEVGVSWGDFNLPDTLKEGNYRIRSYTQLMRNAGPNFFFDKTIKIGNAWINKVFTHVTNEFVGDNTIEKVNSTIAFTDKDGKAYAGTEVGYEVYLQNKKISTGKLTTGAAGTIVIPVVNNQPNLYKSGKIVTTITMSNKTKVVKTIPITATSAAVDVQFFPEGGYLIEGLPNKLAFKAVKSTGLGEDISGKIVDNKGIDIVDFTTSHLGMGALYFMPEANKTYTAVVKFKNGSEQKYNLPVPQKSGYSILVNNTDSLKTNIKVYLTPDLVGKENLQLLAQRGGSIYFSTAINTAKQTSSLVIPKKDFPSGLVQLNLFNEAHVPLWERFIFINNTADKINFEVQNLKSTYTKRENVILNLVNKGQDDVPKKGSFSIAVTNVDAVAADPENESNILTSLLLGSEVVGYIEKPNYYFLHDNVKTRQELDNLLLTQAWRKIDWKKINNPDTAIFKVERGLIISGNVTSLGNKAVAKGKVTLFSNSNGLFSIDTLTDASGNFKFGPLVYADNTKFVAKGLNAKGKDYTKVNIDVIPKQPVTDNKNYGDIELNVNNSIKGYLNNSNSYFDELVKQGLLEKTITLNAVEITGMANRAPNSLNLNGPGAADFVATSADFMNARSFKRYISSSIPGLEFAGTGPFARPFIRGFTSQMAKPIYLSIFLDNIELDPEMSLDEQVQMNDVESIELLTSQKYTALYGAPQGGALVVTTKNRGSNRTGYVAFIPNGFNDFREFYSPKYGVESPQKLDLRTTVYWNPNLLYNDHQNIYVDYFNTDQAGNYRIVVEGIDVNGNLARNVYYYQVK